MSRPMGLRCKVETSKEKADRERKALIRQINNQHPKHYTFESGMESIAGVAENWWAYRDPIGYIKSILSCID